MCGERQVAGGTFQGIQLKNVAIERFNSRDQLYANLLDQKKVFYIKKVVQPPMGFIWDTNMAAASLFWNNNMAVVTSS